MSSHIEGDKSWDWRRTTYLSPIRDQEGGNCCYAFAVCGVIEVLHRIESVENVENDENAREHIHLSAQDIYNHLIRSKEEDAIGRSFIDAIEFVKRKGCVLESSCPYVRRFYPAETNRRVYLRITTHFVIDLTRDLTIKKEKNKVKEKLLESEIRKAPVVAQILSTNNLSNFKGSGIYSGQKDFENKKKQKKEKIEEKKVTEEKQEYHSLMIVGFGEELNKKKLIKYWIVRNSHGMDWGEAGYGKINRAPCNGKLLIDVASVIRGVTYEDES